MGAQVVTVNDVLERHQALDIQCLDRIYLNAYIPGLQTSAQVVAFLSGHLGYPFPSPALFNQLGQRFRRAVAAYAQANHLPLGAVRQGRRQARGDGCPPGPPGRHRDLRGGGDRGGTGIPAGLDRHPGQDHHRHATVVVLQGRPPGDLLLPAPGGTPTSAPPSSRCVPGSRIRARSGATATSGPSAKPPRPASASPSSPTGSPPARIHTRCSASATGSVPAPSACSFSAGWLGCPTADRHRP
jgi:hypothetical protein